MTIPREQAEVRTGTKFDNAHAVLIGDMANGMKAALTAGVRVIAVTSGKSSENDLRQTGAIEVIPSLTN